MMGSFPDNRCRNSVRQQIFFQKIPDSVL